MKLYWIIIFSVCLVVGIFIVIPAFAPAVTLNSLITSSHVAVGDTLCMVNQSDLAVPFYDNALQMNATDPVILKKKGEALIRCGRISDANQVYDQLLSQNENDTTALVRFGDILLQEGDFAGAVEYYDRVLAITPGNAGVWVRKGDAQLLISVQETQKLHTIAKNLSRQPGSANYQPVSNDQLMSMESYKNAVESYQKAMELDPKLSLVVSTRMLSVTQNQIENYQGILQDIQSSPG